MELKDPKITILVREDHTTIELYDSTSALILFKIKLSPEQLSMALSRLHRTECEAEVFNLDRAGKSMEMKMVEFEIDRKTYMSPQRTGLHEGLIALSNDHVRKELGEEWVSDNYFGSQNSFFTKGDKFFARCYARRWV